jgi:WD40 repeat protein
MVDRLGRASGLFLNLFFSLTLPLFCLVFDLLGLEIVLPSVLMKMAFSKTAEAMAKELESMVKSRDSEYPTHQAILQGIEVALADDGKLSILEILEVMPVEAELDIDQILSHISGLEVVPCSLKKEAQETLNINEVADEIVLRFISLSGFKEKDQQKIIEAAKLELHNLPQRLAKSDVLTLIQTLIGELDTESAFKALLKCDQLAHEFNIINGETRHILQTLARASVTKSQDQPSCILSHSFGATVRDVRFSPDGQYLAAGSNDKSLRLWKSYDNGLTFARLFKLNEHTAEVRAIAFSKDGKFLASAGEDKTIKLWNPFTGTLVHSFDSTHQSGIFSLAFAENDTLASGSWDNRIHLWNIRQGAIKRTLEGHQGAVWALEFSAYEPILASGANDNTVGLWNADSGEQIHTFEGHRNGVFCLAFSHDGTVLATGSWDETIRLWNLATSDCIGILQGHEAAVWKVRFSQDDRHLISSADDKTICIWDLQTLKLQSRLMGHQRGVYGLDFSPQQPLIASGSWDKTLRLWKVDL